MVTGKKRRGNSKQARLLKNWISGESCMKLDVEARVVDSLSGQTVLGHEVNDMSAQSAEALLS